MDLRPDEWGTFAYGLLACIAAICVTYVVLRAWPRQHYPRFFALLAGSASIATMYVFQVPGAGFALIALCFVLFFGVGAIDELFQTSTEQKASVTAAPRQPPTGLGHIAFGALLGLLLALATVSAVLIPPTSLKAWVMHPDPLAERVRRGIDPNKDWADLVTRDRDSRQTAAKLQAENAALTKRATDAEAALSKAQDELGAMTSNTVRGIVVKEKTGSRHANGLVYIGVRSGYVECYGCSATVSSDKIDKLEKELKPGEAIKLQTNKGMYRVVLVSMARDFCAFDLVKE